MEITNILIYKKLAKARYLLQQKDFKKSGANTFSKYNYFELRDFLPYINEINNEVGLLPVCDINNEIGIMTIYDVDNPEISIQFSMQSSEVTLKGANPIQDIGAVQTYMRRYLYMLAYEISENDVIDSSEQAEKSVNKKNTNTKPEKKDISDVKQQVIDLCKALSEKGKRDEVNKAVLTKNKTANPNTIKNEDDLKYVLNLLQEIEKNN